MRISLIESVRNEFVAGEGNYEAAKIDEPPQDYFHLLESCFGELLVSRFHFFSWDWFVWVVRLGCRMDCQKGSCLASFQIVGAWDVDREGDHVVNVYVIETPWVYVDVRYELMSDSKRDVTMGLGGGTRFWVGECSSAGFHRSS